MKRKEEKMSGCNESRVLGQRTPEKARIPAFINKRGGRS
jgi:hypothetical protein